MINSSNPALSRVNSYGYSNNSVTTNGVINKTIILFGLMLTSGYMGVNYLGLNFLSSYFWPILIINMLVAFVYIFKPNLTFLAPVYSITEGLLLTSISLSFETMYPGIISNAIVATLTSFFSMLFLYKSRIIKVTNGFKKFMMISLTSILILYLGSFLFGLFGADLSFLFGSGNFSLGISIFVIAIASLSLILDFNRIEEAEKMRVDKKMEYYLAFGLILTIVWLYLEMLRLLAKLRDR